MLALDASALLAFLFQEPGQQYVADRLNQSCLSSVNLCEVLGRFARDGHDSGAALSRLLASPIEFVPFVEADANSAAALLPISQNYGFSLGDRACLALAQHRSIPAVTADYAWAQLDLGVKVELIR